jgi:hypothetical protein
MTQAEYIKQHGLTIALFAHWVGVSDSMAKKLNTGERVPGRKNEKKIAKKTENKVTGQDYERQHAIYKRKMRGRPRWGSALYRPDAPDYEPR